MNAETRKSRQARQSRCIQFGKYHEGYLRGRGGLRGVNFRGRALMLGGQKRRQVEKGWKTLDFSGGVNMKSVGGHD